MPAHTPSGISGYLVTTEVKEAKETPMSNPRWKYQDGRGVWQEGVVLKVSDFGGTDIVYQFKRDDGTVDVVSGARLKTASRIWPSQETKS